MDYAQLGSSWGTIALVVLSTVCVYASVIVYTRIAGLRGLATMSSFDFAATVAIGSTVAATASLSSSTVSGVVVLGCLFTLQTVIALARRHGVARVVDNEPLLLMVDGRVLGDNLRTVRVTEHELMSQLRQHGVLELRAVRAVIMESTGSISVLRGPGPLDLDVLAGVRDADQVPPRGSG